VPSDRVHLHIADVILAVPATVGIEAGMVVLTEDDPPFRSLRIIIGQSEARAIQAAWHGAVPGRPATWDLFISTVAILGGRLDCAVITAVQEERHYFAVIELEQAGERRIMACRPSDALALAVRGYNVDIFAEASVLADAGLLPDGTKAREAAAATDAASAGLEGESPLAAREAALAAREAELAARERALSEREGGSAPAPSGRSEIAAEALEVAADAVAVAAEALEPAGPAVPPEAPDP
jgi:bifunctional DNase/RNase